MHGKLVRVISRVEVKLNALELEASEQWTVQSSIAIKSIHLLKPYVEAWHGNGNVKALRARRWKESSRAKHVNTETQLNNVNNVVTAEDGNPDIHTSIHTLVLI